MGWWGVGVDLGGGGDRTDVLSVNMPGRDGNPYDMSSKILRVNLC